MLKPFTILTLLMLQVPAHGASFDCAKASTKVELLICGDPGISQLDSKLAARYELALKEDGDQRVLRKQQRTWLRESRNRCLDSTCLRASYLRRIGEFDWITTTAYDISLCEEFREHHNRRMVELHKYAMEEKEIDQRDANWMIPNIDIDGDKVNDQILLLRSGSGSRIPSDNSIFTMVLSATGKTFTIEAQGFWVIGYKSKYYLLTGNTYEASEEREIYRLDRMGTKKLCTFECRLPSGQCGSR